MDLGKHLPDPTDADSLNNVEVSDNTINLGGDEIPLDTLEGAMTVELCNAAARGEDTEAILKEFESDLNNNLLPQFESVSEDSKGVYL